MKSNKEWLIPLTGVAFIVMAIVSFAIAGEPPNVKDDTPQKIVDHYVDNKDSVMIGAGVATFAGVLLVFFFGYVREILRAAEGENGMLSLVAFAGAVIGATGIAIDSMISFVLAEAADDIDLIAVQSLQALWDNDFLPIALGITLMLSASGLSIVRHGALPKWLGWISILLAVVSVTPVGFIAFPGMALWILIVSVLLAVRARAQASPPGQTSLGTTPS